MKPLIPIFLLAVASMAHGAGTPEQLKAKADYFVILAGIESDDRAAWETFLKKSDELQVKFSGRKSSDYFLQALEKYQARPDMSPDFQQEDVRRKELQRLIVDGSKPAKARLDALVGAVRSEPKISNAEFARRAVQKLSAQAKPDKAYNGQALDFDGCLKWWDTVKDSF